MRKGVWDCLAYIEHYSFRPLLFPSAAEGEEQTGTAWRGSRRAGELVRRWKRVMKTRQRGRVVTEEDETGREVKRLASELMREDMDEVIEVLCEPGGLVPVSRACVSQSQWRRR